MVRTTSGNTKHMKFNNKLMLFVFIVFKLLVSGALIKFYNCQLRLIIIIF